jgi:hypothetical protein
MILVLVVLQLEQMPVLVVMEPEVYISINVLNHAQIIITISITFVLNAM